MIGDYQFSGQYGIFTWKFNETEIDDENLLHVQAMTRLIQLGDRRIEEIKEEKPKEKTIVNFNQLNVEKRSENIKKNIENVTSTKKTGKRGNSNRGRPKKQR